MLYEGKYSLKRALLSEALDYETWKAQAMASGYKVAQLDNGNFARVNASGQKFNPRHRGTTGGEHPTEEAVYKAGHRSHVRAHSGKDTQSTFSANMKSKYNLDVKAGGVGRAVDLEFPNGAHGELGGRDKYTECGKWNGSKFVSADYPKKVAVLNNAQDASGNPAPIQGTVGAATLGNPVSAALVYKVWINSGDDIIIRYKTKEGSEYEAFALTAKGMSCIPGKEITLLKQEHCNDSTVGNKETGSSDDPDRQGIPFSSLKWEKATKI